MRVQLTLIFIILGFYTTCAYLEVSLQRRQENIDLKIYQFVKTFKKCPQNIQSYKYNTTIYTQMCFHRDLTFTVETLIGDVTFNYEVAAIAIDLHSPISWLKSHECKSCDKNTTIPKFSDAKKLDCKNSCLFDDYQNDFIVTNKYRKNKHGSIVSDNQYLYGEFISSRFSFLAYNPDKKKSMFRYIEEQLQKDSFEKYEDLITFPSLKMLAAQKFIGYDKYLADGVIGLGLNKINSSDADIETNTDIMQALSSAVQEIDDRVFGIYINEIGSIFKDYVLILGGINKKYSHKQLENIQYVNASSETSYYWNLPIEKITFYIPSIDPDLKGVKDVENFNVITPKKKSSILSLSTTFIALPQTELLALIKIINRYGKTDCKIVDFTYSAVYCTNIHTEALQTLEVTFEFTGGAKLTLDYKQLQRQCQVDQEYIAEDKDANDCLLNFQLSPTDNIILGEPFLKKHYTIFDQDKMRVGFLPAADNTYWRKEFYEQPSIIKYLLRLAIAVFIFGLIFLVCIAQIMKMCKWFRRKWNGEDEYNSTEKRYLTQSKEEDDDVSYDDVELSMREKALNELKNEQSVNDNDFAHTEFNNNSTFDDGSSIQQQIQQDNFPSIPQPHPIQADLIEIEQQKPFDHGFNFVNDKTNPFDQNDDISISLEDGNQQKNPQQ